MKSNGKLLISKTRIFFSYNDIQAMRKLVLARLRGDTGPKVSGETLGGLLIKLSRGSRRFEQKF